MTNDHFGLRVTLEPSAAEVGVEPILLDVALVTNVGNPEGYCSNLQDDMRVHSKN